jgi:hypothetical protein
MGFSEDASIKLPREFSYSIGDFLKQPSSISTYKIARQWGLSTKRGSK